MIKLNLFINQLFDKIFTAFILMLKLSFVLKSAVTAPGEYVCVVGNWPELGRWKVSRAACLFYHLISCLYRT